jgi:NAD(P)-dependent dehydrogenase (short-subunit alcohol dehydrogenase family)
MLNPKGTRALITGASRGIGLAYAEALVHAGYKVVLNHLRDAAKAEQECKRLGTDRCYTIEADVGDSRQARSLVSRAADLLGGLDIVVNNAGIAELMPILAVTDETWQRHVNVNLSAGFSVTQEAAKQMIDAGNGGRIIFTTSVGAFRSNATQTHYCATKGGLSLLAQGFALELAKYKITVNCIAPGWIHTDLNDAASRDTDFIKDWLRFNCPSGRLGKPSDLKAALLFFASQEAEYVTGTTVAVDGGWNAQL